MAKARAIIAGPSAWRFRALVTSLASGQIVRLAWWYRRIHRPWFLPRGAGTWWAECGGRDCYYPSHGSHRSHLMSQARITEHCCKGLFLLAWFVYHWGWTKTASFLEFCFLSLSHCFSVFWCVSKCNIWSWQWEFGEEKVLGPRPRMMIGRWLQMSHDNSATRITSVFISHQFLPLETGWNGFICGGFKHIGKATNFRWLPGRGLIVKCRRKSGGGRNTAHRVNICVQCGDPGKGVDWQQEQWRCRWDRPEEIWVEQWKPYFADCKEQPKLGR